ncbi:hypothetical protein BCR35DRAFT_350090 [Leucosporidium creatinivorum]|uniref:F-box domain-containing protein n=1 Tax=Leucosporidium creatinivorum TaxID=106004 RepID=A0A1Y2FZR0_9BASI|nr:hypothetical protein BCR35DRAFT_350090 [Leucosporidium creatinivorum]
MASSLPTELIKHILELLYEDVRSYEPYNPDSPFGKMDGEHVAFIFYPFLFVSKIFFALSLPILARHLFRTSTDLVAISNSDRLLASVASLDARGLKSVIKSLTLPPNLSATEAAAVLRGCTRLNTLHLFDFDPIVHVTPSSITTLLLTTNTQSGLADLPSLARAFPRLASLWLEGSSRDDTGGPIILKIPTASAAPGWCLRDLVIRDFVGAEDELVAFLEQLAPTLETLSLINDTDQLDKFEHLEIVIGSVVDRLTAPFPRLRGLRFGELTWLSCDSVFFNRRHLPLIAEIALTLDDNSLPILLELPPSLSHALLAFAEIELGANSPEMDILLKFVEAQSHLQLLSIDITPWNVECSDDWSERLQELCAERGVMFGCNKWDRKDNSGAEDYLSELSDSDKPFDFDAEDGEEWAHLWSEEKRQVMGLGKTLEAADTTEAPPDPEARDGDNDSYN